MEISLMASARNPRRYSRDPFALDSGFARRYARRRRVIKTSFVLLPLVFIVGLVVFFAAYKSTIKEVTFTVQSKESVTVPTGDTVKNQYRVYTDHGVYVVEDTWIFFNFRAADRYAKLLPGHKYTCKQAGWRFGFTSSFPNLIECDEVAG
jgi:hypothetical protein